MMYLMVGWADLILLPNNRLKKREKKEEKGKEKEETKWPVLQYIYCKQ